MLFLKIYILFTFELIVSWAVFVAKVKNLANRKQDLK